MADMTAETGGTFWTRYENHYHHPFGRKLRKLRKKYPNVKNDLRELLSDMENGNMSGVPIP